MNKQPMDNQIINTEYIQRSKIFIYPFLYIPYSCLVTPENTYVAWIRDGKEFVSSEDKKIICVYKDIINQEERKDEKKYLLHNRYFDDIIPIGDGKTVYVFKINRINIDWEWDVFLNGEYSLLTDVAKRTIRNFYNEDPMKTYIDVYFNPNKYYERYSQILDIPMESLSETRELLSAPDINKETLIT
jgi:hypothetical protein